MVASPSVGFGSCCVMLRYAFSFASPLGLAWLFQASGPVVCMVWTGVNVVLEGRKMLGATKPSDSAMGTIRGDFCVE